MYSHWLFCNCRALSEVYLYIEFYILPERALKKKIYTSSDVDFEALKLV